MKKATLTLEFEIDNITEDGIEKTYKEIENAIVVMDDDVVDGFILTTNLYDCDNTNDFFLKNAKVLNVNISEEEMTQSVIDEVNENRSHMYEDMPLCIEQFYNLNEHFNGKPLDFTYWVRSTYEINTDFEERMDRLQLIRQ